jgi:hypothetical protein
MKGRKQKALFIKPKLGPEFALVSRRNRVIKDKRKQENKMKCRRPTSK